MSDALAEQIRRKVAEGAELRRRFFDETADAICACARAIEARLSAGGRLLVFGNGGSHCDAEHIAVEFMHPILEKRAALPAVALGGHPAHTTAVANDADFSLAFAREVEVLGRAEDVALGLSTSGRSPSVLRALQVARTRSMLTVAFTGRDGGRLPDLCDHCFVVPSWSIHRIQETHEVLLHLLWDTVHLVRGEEDVL